MNTSDRSSGFNEVISTPEAATPERLSAVLRQSGIANQANVTGVELVARKDLPYSTVCRLAITYDDAAGDFPRSLFLKLGGKGDEPSDIGRSEVEFYSKVAPGMGCPPLIRCYDAAFDDQTGHSHILLE